MTVAIIFCFDDVIWFIINYYQLYMYFVIPLWCLLNRAVGATHMNIILVWARENRLEKT